MKLACVIHRYGEDIAGGSEGHCRGIAQRLAASPVNHDVTVLTTCAKDHITWQNEYPAGESQTGALHVHRFPVARTRSMHRFSEISEIVFDGSATAADEEQWFRENGPEVPGLLDFLSRRGAGYDLILFWSFRYYQTFFGLPLVADRSVLVPTAEEDPTIRMRSLDRFFSLPRGFLFLTPEEQALVADVCSRSLAPWQIVGSGLEPVAPADRLRQGSGASAVLESLGIAKPFVLYLGRIDPNKGCETLLRHFLRYLEEGGQAVPMVMAGPENMPMPDHPMVRRLGFVGETVREALLSNAALLVVPSFYESLSLVLLEAWNHGVPALVNGHCAVLKGQARRSDGALYYRNFDEFARALSFLLAHADVARPLGQQGLAYVDREYRWPHVIQKVDDFLTRLGQK